MKVLWSKTPQHFLDNSKPWIDQRESVRAISGNHVYSHIWKCPANCGNGKLPSSIMYEQLKHAINTTARIWALPVRSQQTGGCATKIAAKPSPFADWSGQLKLSLFYLITQVTSMNNKEGPPAICYCPHRQSAIGCEIMTKDISISEPHSEAS